MATSGRSRHHFPGVGVGGAGDATFQTSSSSLAIEPSLKHLWCSIAATALQSSRITKIKGTRHDTKSTPYSIQRSSACGSARGASSGAEHGLDHEQHADGAAAADADRTACHASQSLQSAGTRRKHRRANRQPGRLADEPDRRAQRPWRNRNDATEQFSYDEDNGAGKWCAVGRYCQRPGRYDQRPDEHHPRRRDAVDRRYHAWTGRCQSARLDAGAECERRDVRFAGCGDDGNCHGIDRG